MIADAVWRDRHSDDLRRRCVARSSLFERFARNRITNQLLSILRESSHTLAKVRDDPGEQPKESEDSRYPREAIATYRHANVM